MSDGDRVREALRWPADTHHVGCESKRTAGAPCDCYGFLTNAAHEALDRLEADRDQWHSAANENAERAEAAEAERDEAFRDVQILQDLARDLANAIEAADSELDRLREALTFYGKVNYVDDGVRARAALAGSDK